MRVSLALTALATALAATAAPATSVAFTAPLWDRPVEIENFAEAWPEAPTLKQPIPALNVTPKNVVPPYVPSEAPDPNYLHREPHSEEWNCYVPLGRAEPAQSNNCKTPSIAPDDLFHLL